jgi:hypothetical protein
MTNYNSETNQNESDFGDQKSFDKQSLNKKICDPDMQRKSQPAGFRRASCLAVKGYESGRLGCEVCFGLLPESYD